MARKQSGGRFSRFLEFIGVVEENSQDSDELLNDAQGYGGGTTYEPRSSRSTTVSRSGGHRADTHVPAYTGSTPRRSSIYDRDDDFSVRRSRNPERRDYGNTRPNPAMSRNASSRANRAARFTEAGAASARAEMARTQPLRETRPQRMVMLSMQRLEDCCDVIDHLIAGNMVLLTLDDMDVKLYQRVVDTLSGAVYALKAKIRKASEKTYLVAPGNVDIDDAEYVARNY